MSVRAKFLCIEKGEAGYSAEGKTSKLAFVPVTGNSEENKKFFTYTPTGKLELGIVNSKAAAQFEVGQEYYVDFVNPKELRMAEPITAEPALKEKDLLNILAKNNKQLVEAIEKEKAAKVNKCPDLETAIQNVGIESGEALMIVKLIQYLNGEKNLEEIA
jgi:hypothetical protein